VLVKVAAKRIHCRTEKVFVFDTDEIATAVECWHLINLIRVELS